MNKQQLIAKIKESGKVDNDDAAMHADAILAGSYSLIDLLANAHQFYSFDGYAHESMLMDQM